MKHITFYLDFLSPYTWLAFERLPQELQGLSYSVSYQPVLLGALLQHHGQRGPAEMPHKREWTYRQVLWLAHQQGTPLQMPVAHPFNPLPLLRLAFACVGEAAPDGMPNRYATGTILRHVWQGGGADALDPARLQALVEQLQPPQALDSDAVKQRLRASTDAALALGVFGVPAFRVDDRLFWGQDALPMLRAYLDGELTEQQRAEADASYRADLEAIEQEVAQAKLHQSFQPSTSRSTGLKPSRNMI